MLDYIWYIGEALNQKYGSPSSGDTLLLFLWLFAFLIPLIIPLIYLLIGNPATIILGLGLIFLPFVFCKLRYTNQRRKAIFKHYSEIRSIYMRWCVIMAVIIGLSALNFILMYHFGFITKMEENSIKNTLIV